MNSDPRQLKHFVTPEKTKHHAELLANRVRNRFSHFYKKYKRQNIDCFRLYDWDIPEVRAVVDYYAGHVVVAEYERQQTSVHWVEEMANAVGEALKVPIQQIHVKRRRTKVEKEPRYQKLDSRNEKFVVQERDLKFWVNASDFLDTGLFSDHRDTRLLIRKFVQNEDFLNLFAYTGAFSCAASLAGAKSIVTVDRSATYIQWTKDNLELNGLWGAQHQLIQSDVGRFLQKMQKDKRRFTVAMVDPPSFFQDEAAGASFDINLDHPELLQEIFKVMAPGATVFFSTNHQRFEPKLDQLDVASMVELTPQTIPEDYRNRKVHRCWRMVL